MDFTVALILVGIGVVAVLAREGYQRARAQPTARYLEALRRVHDTAHPEEPPLPGTDVAATAPQAPSPPPDRPPEPPSPPPAVHQPPSPPPAVHQPPSPPPASTNRPPRLRPPPHRPLCPGTPPGC